MCHIKCLIRIYYEDLKKNTRNNCNILILINRFDQYKGNFNIHTATWIDRPVGTIGMHTSQKWKVVSKN